MSSPIPKERLSVDDAQILRLETAAIKGHTGKVLILAPDSEGRPLSVPRLRERIGERMAGFPRLSQRVIEPRLGLGRPAWAPVEEVDLDWHVAEPAHAEPLSDDEFRWSVGELLAERLDHTRPLWRIDALPLTGGRVGLIGRIHHAMADGVSAIALSAGILWDPPSEPAAKAAPPAKGSNGGSAPPAPAAAAKPAQSSDEARILVRLPAALWRELRPGAETALDQHIGPKREVAWTSFPLERMKRIEHGCGVEGVTVNDVVLAIVAGGLRRWMEGADGGPRRMRVQCPVCLHARESGGQLGNRDSFMNVDLPISEPDPVERLKTISTETSERKLHHDADTLYSFFHALGRFRPLYKGVTRLTSGPREFALSVSNVPGPRERPLILEHAVEQFCSFAEPADRHALRLSVVSLGGELAFGLCSDPEAISDLDGLRGDLADSLAELEGSV